MKRIILAVAVTTFAFSSNTFAMHTKDHDNFVNRWDNRVAKLTKVYKHPVLLKRLKAEPSAAKRMMMRDAYFGTHLVGDVGKAGMDVGKSGLKAGDRLWRGTWRGI